MTETLPGAKVKSTCNPGMTRTLRASIEAKRIDAADDQGTERIV
jgi:hypothetical protein